jgi:homoserine kinase type II
LNYGNFLLKNDEVIAVLDFDMSFYWYVIYDVASLLYWWAMPNGTEIDENRMVFIAKTYNKYRELTDTEKNHIFDILKLIILLGLSWSDEDEFLNIKKAIDKLNTIGRENFSNLLFN